MSRAAKSGPLTFVRPVRCCPADWPVVRFFLSFASSTPTAMSDVFSLRSNWWKKKKNNTTTTTVTGHLWKSYCFAFTRSASSSGSIWACAISAFRSPTGSKFPRRWTPGKEVWIRRHPALPATYWTSLKAFDPLMKYNRNEIRSFQLVTIFGIRLVCGLPDENRV